MAEHKDEMGYPCAECGKLRSKSEGGTTFTVCDECWESNKLRNRSMMDQMICAYWHKRSKEMEAENERLRKALDDLCDAIESCTVLEHDNLGFAVSKARTLLNNTPAPQTAAKHSPGHPLESDRDNLHNKVCPHCNKWYPPNDPEWAQCGHCGEWYDERFVHGCSNTPDPKEYR